MLPALTEASVTTHPPSQLTLHHGCQRQAVEALHASVVHIPTKLLHTLRAKIIPFCVLPRRHTPTLVVSTQQEHSVGVHDLQTEQEGNHLAREAATIDIVPKEEVAVVASWGEPKLGHSHLLFL